MSEEHIAAMTREDRVRAWLVACRPVLDELRAAEIDLALALDALHREVTARHADTADLVDGVASAADQLGRRARTALQLPKVPAPHGEVFFRAACQRFVDVSEQFDVAGGEATPDDLSNAAEQIRIAREELDKALDILANVIRPSTAS